MLKQLNEDNLERMVKRMILRMPAYCWTFSCIAQRCQDNCCIGWEIDIDDTTAAYYDTIGGTFGMRLKENITDSSPRSFRLDAAERCPFLNGSNLCDIITELGESHLCRICADHPRYFTWFDGVKEGGIGLCCEEAARIILSWDEPFSLWEQEIPADDCALYDKALYTCMSGAREVMLAHLQNCALSLTQCLQDVVVYARRLQTQTDNGCYTVSALDTASAEPADVSEILHFFTTLEPLDERWQKRLGEQIALLDKAAERAEEFISANPQVRQYLRNIAAYFLWRHFLKGVFDEEFYSRVFLCAVSTAVIGFLFVCRWMEAGTLPFSDCVEIAKSFSKEIEYSEENLDALADFSYQFFRI